MTTSAELPDDWYDPDEDEWADSPCSWPIEDDEGEDDEDDEPVCLPEPMPAKGPRIGHRMRELHAIVSAIPGITKSDALRAAGLPTHGLGSGRELNRAIAAGLIIVEHERSNLTHLFASERDRRRWHLAREALSPGTPAERVAELRAEVSRLDAERAATWTPARV
jgi:hypothetical protein